MRLKAYKRMWPVWSLSILSAALFPREVWSWVYGYAIQWVRGNFLDWVDYYHYHEGVRRFLFNPNMLYLAKSKITLIGFLYTPLSVLFFLPFYSLPLAYAYVLCGLIIYATTAISGYLIGQLYEQVSGETLSQPFKAALVMISLAFTPTLQNVVFGQVNSIVLLLCLVYLWMVFNRMEFWGGVVLAAAIWLKLYPAILLFLMVHDRRYWRSLPGVLLGLVLPPLVFSHFVPMALYKQYFFDFLPAISGRTILHVMNQSLPGILTRLHRPLDAYKSWKAVKIGFYDNQLTRIFLAMVLLLLLKVRGSRLLVFEAALCAIMPMIIGLGWGYTYVLTLPLFLVALILSMKVDKMWPKIVVCLAYLAFVFPSYKELPFEYQVSVAVRILYYSRYFLAALLLLLTTLSLTANMKLLPKNQTSSV
jgi:hypothetical protein